jgi:hypothetical protein
VPKIVYVGPSPAHAPGLPGFIPGEVRDVSDATAERLLKSVHFGLVETDPVRETASAKPAKSKAQPASEGRD